MKIRPLLENAFSIFSSLSPLQIGMLKRIAAGSFDPMGNVNDNQAAVLDDLVGFGLLDDTYGLTDDGSRILTISARVPSTDVRDARMKGAARREITRKERPEPEIDDVDLGDDDLDTDVEDDGMEDEIDMGGTLRTERKPKKKVSRVKALDSDDFSSFDKEDDDHFDDEGEYKWDR